MEFLTSDEILPKIKEIISKADKSIKIASAWIKGRNFEDILDLARERGLSVEVILRASEFQDFLITDDRVFRKIKETGGRVYLCNRLHAKVIIVDDSSAVVGSANLTDAGLSDLSSGNIEAGVFYDSNDDSEELKKLINYFEELKTQHSGEFGEGLLGFALNPVRPQSFEFILIEDEVSLQSYVEIRVPNGRVLARITSIFAYDMGFFANPFTTSESTVFAPLEDFRKIFSDARDQDWKKAAVYAYTNSNGNRINIATASVMGVVNQEGKLDMLSKPFNVGEAVYKVSPETIREVLNKNFSGAPMKIPVRAGFLEDSDISVFLDAGEIVKRHMLVIGTTGSGKSYFTKRFICNLLETEKDLQIYVFDPHGEYSEALSQCGGENLEHIVFEETLFPVYPEEVTALIEEAGYGYLVERRSTLGKKNSAYLSQNIKPSLRLTGLSASDLSDVILGLETEGDEEPFKKIIEYLKEIYSHQMLTTQRQTSEKINDSLNSKKMVIIYDFKNITNPQTRVNIAGLIMQELFNRNRQDPKKRLIVLEEAHNFAPEKGFGDVSAGRDNLALVSARRIASEGRKFNLGLITITQRPAQVSKFVLAQMNTQAMFRTINQTDIDAISTLIEYAGEDIITALPSLPTGTGILSGMGVPFPVVVQVR